MCKVVLRERETGTVVVVSYRNGTIAQTLRRYPPKMYDVVKIDAMEPMGFTCDATLVRARVVESEEKDCETLVFAVMLLLSLLLVGIAGGIERGLIPI